MKKITFAILLLTILVFQACKTKKDDASDPAVQTGTLKFHLHTNVDTAEADINSGTAYRTSNGKKITLDRVRYYISGIKAYKSDGSFQTLTNDTTMLIVGGQEEYVAGKLAAGNYDHVSFNIGVDAASNKKTPADFKASDARSAQTPTMYLNSISGYIFMEIIGRAATDSLTPDSLKTAFNYEIFSDANLKTVTMPSKSFSMIANKQNEIHITADFGKLLEGLNFKTQATSSPTVGTDVNNSLAAKIPLIFNYEE